ncbi:sensor histidine kinase [Amycolatopsis pithecellobii]|uniref:histidine kinase n=1 Tax=Amycolatopsis pithecellobii TaxID=664692 RepID=A0A6N7YJA2_9PSEU|nr:histidine kinase [Amycolatopsis pithecellobii]MTD52967.1 two-component sensor histidine kinase [Amycolatopsis pithecellobii]
MTESTTVTRRPGLARLRAWPHRHPVAADAVLTAVAALFVLTRGDRFEHLPGERPWWVLLAVLLVVPLVWRRRAPLLVFGWMAAVAAVQWFFARALVADAALLIALYSVAVHCGRKVALWALGVIEFGIAIAILKWAPPAGMLDAFVFLSGLATAAFVLGRNVRTRRAYLASLEDRARRAEHERDQQAQLAAAAERARIAREMHDIVAHNLSVMIALADGAAFAARGNPDEAETAARQVSDTGRQALGEMHRLLGVLRGGQETPRAPQPGIEQLDELVAQVRAAGLPVSLTVAGPAFPLSPTAQLAVYRLVQEALTNVLKHADSPEQAWVRLRYRDPVVEVEVGDDGHGRPMASAVDGHGLSGMAERAAMFDGQIEAGPRPGGGWRVHAELVSRRVAPA